MRTQATGWEKIFAKDVSEKGLVSTIHKEKLNFNSKETNNLIKKWSKDLNRQLTQEELKISNKHMKRCSILYIIQKQKIETTMKYHGHICIGITKIQNTDNAKC